MESTGTTRSEDSERFTFSVLEDNIVIEDSDIKPLQTTNDFLKDVKMEVEEDSVVFNIIGCSDDKSEEENMECVEESKSNSECDDKERDESNIVSEHNGKATAVTHCVTNEVNKGNEEEVQKFRTGAIGDVSSAENIEVDTDENASSVETDMKGTDTTVQHIDTEKNVVKTVEQGSNRLHNYTLEKVQKLVSKDTLHKLVCYVSRNIELKETVYDVDSEWSIDYRVGKRKRKAEMGDEADEPEKKIMSLLNAENTIIKMCFKKTEVTLKMEKNSQLEKRLNTMLQSASKAELSQKDRAILAEFSKAHGITFGVCTVSLERCDAGHVNKAFEERQTSTEATDVKNEAYENKEKVETRVKKGNNDVEEKVDTDVNKGEKEGEGNFEPNVEKGDGERKEKVETDVKKEEKEGEENFEPDVKKGDDEREEIVETDVKRGVNEREDKIETIVNRWENESEEKVATDVKRGENEGEENIETDVEKVDSYLEDRSLLLNKSSVLETVSNAKFQNVEKNAVGSRNEAVCANQENEECMREDNEKREPEDLNTVCNKNENPVTEEIEKPAETTDLDQVTVDAGKDSGGTSTKQDSKSRQNKYESETMKCEDFVQLGSDQVVDALMNLDMVLTTMKTNLIHITCEKDYIPFRGVWVNIETKLGNVLERLQMWILNKNSIDVGVSNTTYRQCLTLVLDLIIRVDRIFHENDVWVNLLEYLLGEIFVALASMYRLINSILPGFINNQLGKIQGECIMFIVNGRIIKFAMNEESLHYLVFVINKFKKIQEKKEEVRKKRIFMFEELAYKEQKKQAENNKREKEFFMTQKLQVASNAGEPKVDCGPQRKKSDSSGKSSTQSKSDTDSCASTESSASTKSAAFPKEKTIGSLGLESVAEISSNMDKLKAFLAKMDSIKPSPCAIPPELVRVFETVCRLLQKTKAELYKHYGDILANPDVGQYRKALTHILCLQGHMLMAFYNRLAVDKKGLSNIDMNILRNLAKLESVELAEQLQHGTTSVNATPAQLSGQNIASLGATVKTETNVEEEACLPSTSGIALEKGTMRVTVKSERPSSPATPLEGDQILPVKTEGTMPPLGLSSPSSVQTVIVHPVQGLNTSASTVQFVHFPIFNNINRSVVNQSASMSAPAEYNQSAALDVLRRFIPPSQQQDIMGHLPPLNRFVSANSNLPTLVVPEIGQSETIVPHINQSDARDSVSSALPKIVNYFSLSNECPSGNNSDNSNWSENQDPTSEKQANSSPKPQRLPRIQLSKNVEYQMIQSLDNFVQLKFVSRSAVDEYHGREIGTKIKMYICRVCDWAFDDRDKFNKHFQKKHVHLGLPAVPDLVMLSDFGKVSCGVCGEADVQHVQSHFSKEEMELRYVCTDCKERKMKLYFEMKEDLVKHSWFHQHGQKKGPTICLTCGNIFWHKSSYQLHQILSERCGLNLAHLHDVDIQSKQGKTTIADSGVNLVRYQLDILNEKHENLTALREKLIKKLNPWNKCQELMSEHVKEQSSDR